jgi:hypothetical protein
MACSVCATDATTIAAFRLGRRPAPTSPPSQADMTRVSLRSASCRTSAGPCRSSCAFGPSSRTGTSTLGPNPDSLRLCARDESVPGTTTTDGDNELVMPELMATSAPATTTQTSSATTGWRIDDAARRSMGSPPRNATRRACAS